VNVKENKEVLKYYYSLTSLKKDFTKLEYFENNFVDAYDAYEEFNNLNKQPQEIMQSLFPKQIDDQFLF